MHNHDHSHDDETPSFRSHKQTPAGLSVWNPGEARSPDRARR